MFRKLFPIFLTVILLCGLYSPTFVRADLTSDLQNEINQKQTQIKELEKQIAEYKAALKSTSSNASTLKSQIQKLENQIKYLAAQVKLTQTKISEASLTIQGLASDIQTQEITINKQKENLAETLRAINEYDQVSPFELILKNENFSDFLNQFQYVQNLQNGLQEKITAIKELKANLESQKSEQENQKASLENLKSQLSGQSSVLNGQADEKTDLLTATRNQEKQYQTILSDLEKKRQQIEQEIYLAEAKLRLAIDPNSIPGSGKGIISWPISGAVTQTFGCIENSFAKRSYPLCNNNRGGFHNGIDIDLNIGDPVAAALAGTVSGVGNLGKYAYGKWITIRHENGLTTLYAHLSVQSVSVGQQVKTGQVIGYGGSTGYSTGSHLHFTVYATNTFSIEQKWYGPLPLGGALNPLSYL